MPHNGSFGCGKYLHDSYSKCNFDHGNKDDITQVYSSLYVTNILK